MGKRARVPGCTHIDVARTHIPQDQCHLCLTASPLGFLYECQQECDRPTLREVIEQHSKKLAVEKSDLRQQLECAGLSESVIITAELGHYTEPQLKLLQMQKADLRQAIQDALELDQVNSAIAKWTAMIPSNHDGTISSRMFAEKIPPPCELKACHHCRPYFRERVPTSIQAVLLGEFHPLTREDIALLPVKSALVVRTIGMAMPRTTLTRHASDCMPLSIDTMTTLTTRSAPGTASTSSASSDLTFHTTQSDLDGISAERSPRRLFYKSSRKHISSSSNDTVLQSKKYRGLRAVAQKWLRSHRSSKSEDMGLDKVVMHDVEMGEYDKQCRQKHGEATTLHLDGTQSEAWVLHRSNLSSVLEPATVHSNEAFSSPPSGPELEMDSSLSSDEFSVYTFASGDESEPGTNRSMSGDEQDGDDTGEEAEDIMTQI